MLTNKRKEFGDWQTSLELATLVCEKLAADGVRPQVVVEPTCGRGNFIVAALKVFGNSIRRIYGIEIRKQYIEELEQRLAELRAAGEIGDSVEVRLQEHDIFTFNLSAIAIAPGEPVLVVGNPPWATNSALGRMESGNLPDKTNYRNLRGVEAITGKGNFDIAESIVYKMMDAFCNKDITLAMLVKSSVARNVVYEQRRRGYWGVRLEQYDIDAHKEFGVAVSACLLKASKSRERPAMCTVADLYTSEPKSSFGWLDGHFVADAEAYGRYRAIDGRSQLTWWSGLKHDCAKVMELDGSNGRLTNGLGEEVEIEGDVLYPLMKSSDIKNGVAPGRRKYVVVTQTKPSEPTVRLKSACPKAYDYLLRHARMLDNRSSSIYRKRPRFAIFGIGTYSFQSYKVAISGLYKSTKFALVEPIGGKSTMLDDTCYLLGFRYKSEAELILKLLNSDLVQGFLRSLVFSDAKRCINKETLMRIDLLKAAAELLRTGYIDNGEYREAQAVLAPTPQTSPVRQLTFEFA